MTKYLSRKIKFMSLFMMIGVVFLHSYNYKDDFLTPSTAISEGFNPASMFEFFISNGIVRMCVPMFFAISGYLFFRTFRPSLKCYRYKLKSRFFSLAVPYLIWSLLSLGFVFLMSIPDFTAQLPVIQQNLPQNGIDLAYIVKCIINPPSFQLWYVQQLIIFTVISPLIYLMIKYTKGIIVVPIAVLWLMDLSFIINSEAALFYMLGACIAIFDREDLILIKESRGFCAVITTVWILINLIKTFIAAIDEQDNMFLTVARFGLTKISILLGLVSMWLLFDHIVKRIQYKKGLLLLSGHMFFIYTLHEPLLHMCYQLALRLDASNPAHIALYICLPISIIAFSVIVSMCVRKLCLPLHKVLTGNRSN